MRSIIIHSIVVWICLFSFCLFEDLISDTKRKIIFVILSQHNLQHERISSNKKLDIEQQLSLLNNKSRVFVAPQDFPSVDGYWTFSPLIKYFEKEKNLSWLFFIEETTNINVSDVLGILDEHQVAENSFVGHAIRDKEPTIIHHFDDPVSSMAYPHSSPGFALSQKIVQQFAKIWDPSKSTDFSIDPKYELAKFLYEECDAVSLTHEPKFCVKKRKECATYVNQLLPSCKEPTSKKEVYFAVKTCQKYHKSRVPIVKNTWASDAHRIFYFSDVKDSSVPTVNLKISNVQHGHCEKTLRIIQYFIKHHLTEEKWLVIADDDSLFSISRLLKLLSWYDPESKVALGERYGYLVTSGGGYDYITGGGGMVFSLPTAQSIATECKCPSLDSPDDMILGMCLKQLGIPITHLPHFHQARHQDYSQSYLDAFVSVSFHKHWMIDPISEYALYLKEKGTKHDEL